MGLEVATFVDGLVVANPPGTDQKAQGDDHLRLIKTVLKNTFPSASKVFRFPTTKVKVFGDSPYTMLAADDNVQFEADAVGGAITFNLLAAATAGAGYLFRVIKSDSSANAITLDPNGAETINGAATLTLDAQYNSVTVWTDGSEWFAMLTRADPEFASGTVMLFQQTAAPTGWTKGATHNDKALRVVTGTPTTGGATAFGTVFGAGKATAGHTLVIGEMPGHTHGAHVGTAKYAAGGGVAGEVQSGTSVVTGSTGGDGSHAHNLTLDLQFVDVIIATKD